MVPFVMYVTYAAVAELADAQDLKSCGTYTPVPVRFRSAALVKDGESLNLRVLYFFYTETNTFLTLIKQPKVIKIMVQVIKDNRTKSQQLFMILLLTEKKSFLLKVRL